ncbi:MAG: DAK2 domain-containing protein [Acidimicrobiia bacterium]
MPTLSRLGAEDLKALMAGYRDALRAHQEAVNRLNVHPVPDGDTGTNMALTLESVVSAVSEAGDDMASVCKAISHGSLMGARGNSGVILSQVLRGFADICKTGDGVGAEDFATALEAAAAAAYQAVMRPVEGTILTVVREAAAGAMAAAKEATASVVDVLDAAKAAGQRALDDTPELLPVLKQAGVVDAGGAGFMLFLDAALRVVADRPIPEPPAAPAGAEFAVSSEIDAAHDSVSDLRYEVMYFLEAPDETIPHFKQAWAGIGDSIVVVGGDGIWNCHIHTDDIGAAIEAALDAGRPKKIRVTDLMEQVEEERWVRDAAAERSDDNDAEQVHQEPVPTAVVAVGTGPGIRRIFRSLGVQQIVAGGQSMNPSTAQILEAVEAAPAEQVVVLPNNKNIIPVAEQVAPLTTKQVRVVKTKGVAEGFAALLQYDPEADVDENLEAMTAAASSVVSAEVTQAVRDSDSEAGPIKAGDFIGISRDGIISVATTLAEASTSLLAKLLTDDHEIVTLITGEGSSEADTRRLTEWVAEQRPGVVVEVHHGGQPLYPYLFSIE